jgi:uroporphyrinogen-III synthase
MRLLVTRPQPQAQAWVERLRSRGFDAVALPLIEIAPAPDAAAVEAAWRSLGDRALVVFVSPSAVERFFAARPEGAVWPDWLDAASVGPGTTRALQDAGVDNVLEPPPDAEQFDSESLWLSLAGRDWRRASVLLVRGHGGREWLADQLREAGATVDKVAAYTRRAPAFDDVMRERLSEALAKPRQHVWLFSSSEAIEHLREAAGASADWSHACALATHPRIAERARSLGVGRILESRPSLDAVAAVLQKPKTR